LDQKRLTTGAAPQLLGLELWQVFGLLTAYRTDGTTGMISKRHGGRSNRRKPEVLRRAVLAMIRDWYRAVFPTRLSPQRAAMPEFDTTAQGLPARHLGRRRLDRARRRPHHHRRNLLSAAASIVYAVCRPRANTAATVLFPVRHSAHRRKRKTHPIRSARHRPRRCRLIDIACPFCPLHPASRALDRLAARLRGRGL